MLRAAQRRDPQLALKAVAHGANLSERDENGNYASHYAAAYGYTAVLAELVRRGAEIGAENDQGDSPLMYAILYGQAEAAKLIWGWQESRVLTEGGEFGRLVRELCAIGVDITLTPDETVSGFRRRDESGNWFSHPRAVEIGRRLLETDGDAGMSRAAEVVSRLLGPRAAGKLSSCWNGIGGWMD